MRSPLKGFGKYSSGLPKTVPNTIKLSANQLSKLLQFCEYAYLVGHVVDGPSTLDYILKRNLMKCQ